MRVKILLCCLIFFTGSNTVLGDYDESALLKLFTDKKQRAYIDARRAGITPQSEKKRSEKVRVSGYVKRSDGRSVVWVNNGNTLKKSRVDDVVVHQKSIGKNKSVGITVDGKNTRLKPGEELQRNPDLPVN